MNQADHFIAKSVYVSDPGFDLLHFKRVHKRFTKHQQWQDISINGSMAKQLTYLPADLPKQLTYLNS